MTISVTVTLKLDKETHELLQKCKKMIGADSDEATVSRALALLDLGKSGMLLYKAEGAQDIQPIEVKG